MTTTLEITDLIKKGSNDQLEVILNSNPSLANEKTEHGVSLLMFAAYCRNSGAVTIFRKHKPQLDLYEAVAAGDLATVQKMITASPGSINQPSSDGFSALGFSCYFGNLEIAQYLVENGADVNLPSANSFKVAPIHSACAISDYAITELLLKNGANPNATQQSGVTPLHEAAHNGKAALVKLLVDYKADINAKMDNGQTPLAMALEKSFEETAELIRQYGGH